MFDLRRRQVITVLIGAAVAGPLAARAQVPGRRPVIAYLAGASSASAFASTAPSLLKGLRDLGYVDGLAGKTLMLATQLVPGSGRIGVLVNVGSAESIDQLRDMNDAAQKLHLKIVRAEVRKPDDLEAAFATLAGERVDALVVLQD